MLVFYFLLIISVTIDFYAQTLEVIWNKPFLLPKNNWYYKVLGSDDVGIYLLKTTSPREVILEESYLEYFNVYSNSIETSSQLYSPYIGSMKTEYFDLFYLDKKLILFTTLKNNNNKELYVQYINSDGSLKNIPKKVGEIPITNYSKDDFKLYVYENNFYLLYHNTFNVYNKEPIYLKVLNTDLIETQTHVLVPPLVDEYFEIEQFVIGKSKYVYLLLKVLKKDKKNKSQPAHAKKSENYSYVLLTYNPRRKEYMTFDITVGGGKYLPVNAIMRLDGEENIVVTGFMSNKNPKIPKQFDGAYYLIINPRTQKNLTPDIKKSVRIFSKEFIAQNSEPRNGTDPEKFNDYTLKHFFFFEEGGFAVIAENSYSWTDKIVDPATKKVTEINYYVNNDLIIYGVDKDGTLKWNFRIPRNAISTDDDGYYNQVACIYDNNKIRLYFNDQKANLKNKESAKTKVLKNFVSLPPKGFIVTYTIFSDGSYEKYPALKSDDEKWVLIPRLLSFFNRSYILFVQDGRNIKCGTFTLD